MRPFLAAAAAFVVLSLPAHASTRLPLRACWAGDGKALCGTFRVPENRARPSARSIALNVVVLPATRRPVLRDPIVFLAGGPGGAATELADGIRSAFSALNRHRDVLLVDQRGTGRSGRLVCPPVPATVTDAQSLAAYVKACQTSLHADFTQYGTAAAVDDVDAVRAALGYRKVNLYGGSYGATAAQVYLNRHASSVRSVILDSGTLLEVPIFELWGSNAQRALDQVAARCAAEKACAAEYPRWESDLGPLVERLNATPVQVDVVGTKVTLTGDAVATTVHALTLTADGAANVPRDVAHAVSGDYQPIARALASLGGEDTSRLVMAYSTMCSEPWAVWDAARAAADADPTYMAHAYRATSERQALVCSVFPRHAENAADWRNPRSNVPMLVLVGGADPQDPIGNIAAIRKTMPRARILVAPGLGHGVGQAPCLAALAAQFVARGTASGLATGCVHRIAPPSFVVD